MNKPLNYIITFNYDMLGMKSEEIYFSHLATIERYIEILNTKKNINGLKVWKVYANDTKEEYTQTIDNFLVYGK